MEPFERFSEQKLEYLRSVIGVMICFAPGQGFSVF